MTLEPGDNVFSHNLLRLKTEQDASWRDLADALGHRNSRYVQQLAAGEYEPRLQTVRRLADFFGVTVAEMVEEPNAPASE